MEQIKLAQYANISEASSDERYAFLKNNNINVNTSLSDQLCQGYKHNAHAGYSYLHFAAENTDLTSVNELIRRNADLLKQGSKNGQTPLHIVGCRFEKDKKDSYSRDNYFYVVDYVGKLKEDKIVNALLSAQVENQISANPKSNNGTSHLHIACMYNHIKSVKLFLNAGEPVDHATNNDHQLPGYTALHFSIRHSALESTYILLNHGANIHLKNSAGQSPLHLLIERLMGIANFLARGKRTYRPFYKKERGTLESMLEMFLKSKEIQQIATSDNTGLTPLHIACTFSTPDIAMNFLACNVNFDAITRNDSKLWPGWTPLHFSACFCIETFKLLLAYGADFRVKNTKGETPLDLCMARYTPDVVYEILSTKEELRTILLTDRSTKLSEVLLLMSNDDLFREWMKSLKKIDITVSLDSPIWPGYNLLHLVILNERLELTDKKMVFESSSLSAGSQIEKGLMDYWEQIMSCLLVKLNNFKKKNADNLSPFHLAYKLGKKTSIDKLLKNTKVNEIDSNGLSSFHIACATYNMEAIESLVKGGVKLNEPVKTDMDLRLSDTESIHIPANSTPLHIAVITRNVRLIEYLLNKGASMHRKDQRGIDPIHLSLITEKHCFGMTKLFLHKMLKSNILYTNNLYCLHVAVICDDKEAIQKLLHAGVDSEIRFEPTNAELRSKFADDIGKTPLYIALSHRKCDAVEELIQGGVDIFATLGQKSNPLLNLAVKHGYHVKDYLFSKLKQKKRYVIKPIDETGATMLHFACEKLDVKWAKTLLKRKADPNACVTSDDECYTCWGGDTPLHVFVNRIYHWIKDKTVVVEMLKLLIEYRVDVTMKNKQGKTPIHVLYYGANDIFSFLSGQKYNEIKLSAIDILLKAQKTFDVNSVDRSGLSHFHLACYTGNLEIVKRFLECGIDVNHAYELFTTVEHHAGYTPLHFALDKKNSDVARLLIEHGANVQAEDLRGDTSLHLAVKEGFIDTELIELILKYGGDINAKNVKGTTPIEYLFMAEGYTLEQLNFMLNQGAVIDLMNTKPLGAGVIGLAMLNAEPNDRLNIFKRILDVSEVKNLVKRGCNIIDSAVNVQQNGKLTVDFYLDVIEQLIDAGCDLDQQDHAGKTALHRATRLYNHEAVKALLLVGANLNVLDKEGEPLLTKEVFTNDKMSDRRSYTMDFVACQIWKMRNMGLNVNEFTKDALLEVLNLRDKFAIISNINYDTVRTLSLRELARARETFINKLHLEQFLSETEAVMQYSRMSVSEREAIDAFFKCRDNIRQGFPEWAGFLLMQYRKAVARTKMLKPAMEVIFSAGIRLPALCLNEIVQYLNYDELKLLFE